MWSFRFSIVTKVDIVTTRDLLESSQVVLHYLGSRGNIFLGLLLLLSLDHPFVGLLLVWLDCLLLGSNLHSDYTQIFTVRYQREVLVDLLARASSRKDISTLKFSFTQRGKCLGIIHIDHTSFRVASSSGIKLAL